MREGRFNVLIRPHDSNAISYFSEEDPKNNGEVPRCPFCEEVIGLIPWLPPYHVELEVWGQHFGDVAFGPGDELLFTDRFIDLYREAGLVGLTSIEPVTIKRIVRHGGATTKGVPAYYCVKLARSRAVVDDAASTVLRNRPITCAECLSGAINRIERIRFVPGSWSGEDIFFGRGLPGRRVVTQRFVDFVRQNDFKNFEFISADDYFDEDLVYSADLRESSALVQVLIVPSGDKVHDIEAANRVAHYDETPLGCMWRNAGSNKMQLVWKDKATTDRIGTRPAGVSWAEAIIDPPNTWSIRIDSKEWKTGLFAAPEGMEWRCGANPKNRYLVAKDNLSNVIK